MHGCVCARRATAQLCFPFRALGLRFVPSDKEPLVVVIMDGDGDSGGDIDASCNSAYGKCDVLPQPAYTREQCTAGKLHTGSIDSATNTPFVTQSMDAAQPFQTTLD